MELPSQIKSWRRARNLSTLIRTNQVYSNFIWPVFDRSTFPQSCEDEILTHKHSTIPICRSHVPHLPGPLDVEGVLAEHRRGRGVRLLHQLLTRGAHIRGNCWFVVCRDSDSSLAIDIGIAESAVDWNTLWCWSPGSRRPGGIRPCVWVPDCGWCSPCLGGRNSSELRRGGLDRHFRWSLGFSIKKHGSRISGFIFYFLLLTNFGSPLRERKIGTA